MQDCKIAVRAKADLYLLLVALIWGATFPLVKVALAYISPFAFNAIRFSISTLAFLILLPKIKVSKEKLKNSMLTGIKIGFVVFLGYSLQTLGMVYSSATNAGYITSLYVVLTPVVAKIFYRNTIKLKELFCTFTALLGMLLMSYNNLGLGNVMLLGCALAFAVEIAMISHNSKKFCSTSLAFWQVFSVAIFSIPFSFLDLNSKISFNSSVILALIITALFATVVARIVQNKFQKFTTAADAAVIFSMEGVFSHLFSFMFLGEKLGLLQLAGAVIIVLSVIAVSL